jgi:hypothetical protein
MISGDDLRQPRGVRPVARFVFVLMNLATAERTDRATLAQTTINQLGTNAAGLRMLPVDGGAQTSFAHHRRAAHLRIGTQPWIGKLSPALV